MEPGREKAWRLGESEDGSGKRESDIQEICDDITDDDALWVDITVLL